MFDLYTDKPVGVAQTAAGQQFETGKKLGAGGLFTSSAAMGAYKTKTEYNQARLNEAINFWGSEVSRDWTEKGQQLKEGIKSDLADIRRKAERARKINDLEEYKLLLQKIMFDKKMLEYSKMMDKARRNEILTGIVAIGGQAIGGFFSSDLWERIKPQIKTGWEQWRQQWKLDKYNMPPIEWDMA